jgi:hypothetical protein
LPIPASGEITDARCAATLACRGRHLLGTLDEFELLTQDGQMDAAEFRERANFSLRC